MLKKVRVLISVVLVCSITLYFLDFADLLPRQLHQLARIQLIPAILSFHLIALFAIVATTLLLGRVYCSTLCPMGVLQDVFSWINQKLHRKRKFPQLKNRPWLRWIFVLLTVLGFFSGFSIMVSVLDPYSAYSRIVGALFKPLYLIGNNLIAYIDNYYRHYRFYKVEVILSSVTVLVIAAMTLIVIGYLSFSWGRLYCNTICPVGTVLGLLSRISILKISINEEKCNSCGLCSMKCKSSCIDPLTATVDHSRCVTCFNCIGVCNRHAISFRLAQARQKVSTSESDRSVPVPPRRQFLAFLLFGIAATKNLFGKDPDSTKKPKEIFTSHNIAFKRKHPLTPPGSGNVKRFNQRCTACHLCVSKCPSNVLTPALLEYGLPGILQPTLCFEHGYCNYKCTVCTEICPAGAIEPITETEKKLVQVGKVHFIKENCVTVTDGTDCGACSEHCPTQAVNMQPYKGDLRIPVIDQDLCVGCGGCEYICPTRPYRAIYVVGNPVHQKAVLPKEEKQQTIEVKDFGF